MDRLAENLTTEQQAELAEAKVIGREVIGGISWALKVARGEVARPTKSLWDNMEELKREDEQPEITEYLKEEGEKMTKTNDVYPTVLAVPSKSALVLTEEQYDELEARIKEGRKNRNSPQAIEARRQRKERVKKIWKNG